MNDLPRTTPRRSDSGFSLIEILIAVTILVLMGGLVAANLFPFLAGAKRDAALQDIREIESAIERYRLSTGKLPNSSEFPSCLTEENPDIRGSPFFKKDRLTNGRMLDPWKGEYHYTRTGNDFEIVSYGEDGSPGGEGDNADISSKKKDGDK